MAGGEGSVVMGKLAAGQPAGHGGLLVVDDECGVGYILRLPREAAMDGQR
jgi:hypothetical protein